MTRLEIETQRWMEQLGFQSNIDAEIPNYQFSLKQFMDPNAIIQEVAKDSPEWDPLDDCSLISPELAKVFYLASRNKWKNLKKV